MKELTWTIETPAWRVTFEPTDHILGEMCQDLAFAFGGGPLAKAIGGYEKVNLDPNEEMKNIVEEELMTLLIRKHHPDWGY